MPFWTYLLHCNGGAFYVGHTDNLERRVAQHERGAPAGFTQDHLPVRCVWSEQFGTREEALAMERRIKGWSRAKKMALIAEIGPGSHSYRAATGKGRPSTSSGRTAGDAALTTILDKYNHIGYTLHRRPHPRSR